MGGVVDNTRKAYNESTRDLSFYSRWVKARTAVKAVGEIGQYGQFIPSSVQDAIKRIQRKDPNAEFSVGREASPVVYVRTGKPRSALGVFSAMSDYKRPDEIDKVTKQRNKDRVPGGGKRGKSLVRAWWD